ncbi:EAL domain-containing protein [Azospirillum sp. SYSU D00513]|uniref:bifunctional diguanylate cyclase/phosphodiesterase n=1 Tax=Azospirillum sp. SYSU D00513 TaxID=2812561 RepID=UPI0024943E21|nr:EAL domain-containing protein [Azospirillum sp. SYSU D00513]
MVWLKTTSARIADAAPNGYDKVGHHVFESAASDPRGRSPTVGDYHRRLPWLALTAGLLLTMLVWHQASQTVRADAQHRFSLRVAKLHSRINDYTRTYEQVARSAAALMNAFPDTSRLQWQRYIEGLELGESFPGIVSVALARRVMPGTEAETESAAHADGVTSFRIRPVPATGERVVNFYTSPNTESNRIALGYDLMSDATRRTAVERTRDTGFPSVSPLVTLKIDEEQGAQPSFILFQSVYRGGGVPATLEERRQAFAGVVLLPIRVNPLLASVHDEESSDIAIRLFDNPANARAAATPERILTRGKALLSREVTAAADRPFLTDIREIRMGGRDWTLRFDTQPGFETGEQHWWPLLVLGSGTALSVSLFILLWTLTMTRRRAEQLAQRMTASLRRREAELHQLFSQAPLGIALIGADGHVEDCNAAFARVTGAPRDRLIGFDTLAQLKDATLVAAIENAIAGRSASLEVEQLSFAGGRASHVSVHLQPVYEQQELLFVQAFIEDIGEKRRAEQHIQYLAHYDSLTGLPNRVLLFDRLGQALRLARRQGSKLAVLFIDLDRFKVINDSLGHSYGDEILRSVARRLSGGLRETDTVARLGGDEFLIVVPGIEEPTDASAVAEKVLAQLASPFAVQGKTFNVSPSIGISLFPDDADDAEGLIRCADIAMYNAKDGGRNAYRFVTKEMGARSRERLDLEASLRRALGGDELFLVYQPQVHITEGHVVGLEALLRWRHPEAGLIQPDRFLSIAEETGMIQEIGDWVLHEACAQIRRWKERHGLSVPVAINLSGTQFRDKGLPDKIAAALAAAGLEGRDLEIEVTESTLIDDIPAAVATLRSLKARGVLVALDDFGTGYSSLSYLHRFPIDKLKIDRSFINDLEQDGIGDSIPRAIVGLGRSLGLSVVAEGVETEGQLKLLRQLNCQSYQGYLFSRPLTPDDLEPMLFGTPGVGSRETAPAI